MKNIEVITGFGYIKDLKGNIVGKSELPLGEHNIQDNFDYIECANKDELNEIKVVLKEATPEQSREIKIQNEIRSMAIERLQARGEI